MTEDKESKIQHAVDDAAFVKEIINKFEISKLRKNPAVLKAQVFIDLSLFFFAAVMLWIEVTTNNSITRDLYLSIHQPEFQKLGLINMGVIVAMIVLMLYLIAWAAWKKSTLSFSSYLEKNFRYLKGLSLGANLSVKFFALCLVIISGRIDFVSPLLLVFIFDEVYHNRIFNVNFREGIVFGVGSLGLATYLLISKLDSVAWALGFFCAIALFSLVRSIRESRRARNLS
jgi:hypothetical protein